MSHADPTRSGDSEPARPLFTLRALAAAALVSAVVVLPFLPMAKPRPPFFALEAQMASSVAGAVKLYYDVGRGFSEVESVQHLISKPGSPQRFRFALPPDSYRGFRFDPIDGAGSVTLVGPLRIVSETGRVVRTVALSELQAANEIESIRPVGDRLEVVTTASANDPQLAVWFDPPLELAITPAELARVVASRAIGVFLVIGAVLLLADRSRRLRLAVRIARAWVQQHPSGAIVLVAIISVVASAYPVVFLGRSYVSPNFATTLLYESYPTLPGYSSSETATGNGSDMGATLWQHVPYAFLQHRAIAGGEFPLWNRYNSAGTPLLAQGQSMFGDPLHWLVILCNGAAWAWDLKYLVAKFLFAAALGLIVYRLTRWRSAARHERFAEPASLPVALVVAAAAPFIGFFQYRINHAAIFSVCYAPCVLGCWMAMAQAVGRRATALWTIGLFVANLALMNSGTVKEAYLLLVQMNLAGAALLLWGAEPRRIRVAKLGAAAWAGVLLVLLTAPVWATFLPTLRNAYTVSGTATASQIQPGLLLGAFDELFFRPLSQGNIVFNPSLNFLFLLGVVYFLATLRQQWPDRTVVVIATAALITLSFAFGLVPPAWIKRIPLVSNVGHIENCFLCGFLVFGATVAGQGFVTAARRLRTPEGRGDLGIAALLLFALVFAWIGFRQAAHRTITPGATFSVFPLGESLPVDRFIWLSLFSLLVASATAAWTLRHALVSGRFGAAEILLLGLSGSVLVWRHGLHTTAMGFDRFTVQPPVRASFHATSPAIALIQSKQAPEPARVFALHGNLTAGWNAVYGLETVHGPDALQNPWLRQLLDVSPLKWNSAWRLYVAADEVAKARPFLDALNVRYYLDLKSDLTLLSRDLALVQRADLDVYESRSAWPRAFFTPQIATHADPAELVNGLVAASHPFASVARGEVARQPALQSLAASASTASPVPARNYELAENSTAFDIHASSPGIAVLTEAWWPDTFRASIDGRRVPILQVNHAFKGVLIDTPGNHRVRFWYWPRNFLRSVALSVTGAVLFLISIFVALRPARTA